MDAMTKESDVWETTPKATTKSIFIMSMQVANELFLEQEKYTLKIFAVQDVEGEAWLGGEHFPHQERVLLLHVVADMFSFNKGATGSTPTGSAAVGSTTVVSWFNCAVERSTLVEDASVLKRHNTASM